MEPGGLRKTLNDRGLDYQKKALLLKECEYFASISPKSIFDNLGNAFKNFGSMSTVKIVLTVVGAVVLIPLCLFFFRYGLVILFVAGLIFLFGPLSKQSPEYRNYDYLHKIAEPTLKLFDDKMSLQYHYDAFDLTDETLAYEKALEEARLVEPIKKNYKKHPYSCASYDWNNPSNTDAFEAVGYKIYYEWEDDDGNTHEEVYFNGTIYKFRTSFTTNGTINIMSTETKKNLLGIEKEKNKFKKIKDKDITVIDTENHEFAENFDTIATYDEEAYRYLTPAMIENLLMLRKNYFFAICIKGNVMTVTIDKGGYRDARQSSLGRAGKTYFASKNPAGDLDSRIREIGNALLSIYELKDILDPGGRK